MSRILEMPECAVKDLIAQAPERALGQNGEMEKNLSIGNPKSAAPEQARNLGAELLGLWSAAFSENSPVAMAALYREDAMLYGSKPELFVGSEGALAYFSTLAPRRQRSVWFDEVTASFATPEVLAIAATAGFVVDQLPAIVMRFTQSWVHTDGAWRVISHHASPRQDPGR